MARPLLSVASLSSVAIALVAGGVSPAFAIDTIPSAEATSTTEAPLAIIAGADESAEILESSSIDELQVGYVVGLKDAVDNRLPEHC